MCGIAGIMSKGGNLKALLIKQMSDVLMHRGPDDEGFLAAQTSSRNVCHLVGSQSQVRGQRIEDYNGNADLFLGHRRLSILDVSSLGHQPMSDADKSLWVVFNGEIYNYIELKEELKSYGFSFKTNCDTEVLLYAYKQWKEECLQKLNGMWSFVIYDVNNNTLFASRDRFGKKPFYYFFDGNNFAFASEIKALLTCPFITKEPNDSIIYDYLAFGYLDHTEETFFKGIRQLNPGHYLIFKDNKLTIKKYYELSFNPEIGNFNESECKKYSEQFLAYLTNSVLIRLRSDVPIGTSFSGGIDSSTIVCLINRFLRENGVKGQVLGKRQKTFSACFNESRLDERMYMKEIIDTAQVDPRFVFPSGSKLWEEIQNLIWHQEEPFGSTSVYAQWNVMKIAKENGIKVLLDGQGADESIAGYPYYSGTYIANLFRKGRLIEAIKELIAVKGSRGYFLSRFLPSIYKPFTGNSCYQHKSNLINFDFLKECDNKPRLECGPGLNLQSLLFLNEVKLGLKSLLKYEDRNAMTFSIEARCPFVDYRLVEFIFSIPGCYKIHNGWSKYILRRSIEGLIPKDIQWRRDKIGFETPECRWLISEHKRISDIFKDSSSGAEKYINMGVLCDPGMFKKNIKINHTQVWRAINLELWMGRMFQ